MPNYMHMYYGLLALLVLGVVAFLFPKQYFTERHVGALAPRPPEGVEESSVRASSASDYVCIGKISVSLDANNTATYRCWGIPYKKS